jgi:hypothetical protein
VPLYQLPPDKSGYLFCFFRVELEHTVPKLEWGGGGGGATGGRAAALGQGGSTGGKMTAAGAGRLRWGQRAGGGPAAMVRAGRL